MSARACVLSLDEVESLVELLDNQRDAICRLLVEVDASRSGVSFDEGVVFDAIGALATTNQMIGKTLDAGRSNAGREHRKEQVR